MNNKTINFIENFGRTTTLAIPSLFCVSYSFSGFTWYTNSQLIHNILSIIHTMINSTIMIVLLSLIMLTIFLLLINKYS